jgi:hypothetical protein
MQEFQQQLEEIKARNKKVEIDKAWEKSKTRIVSIAILTYFIAAAWLYTIGVYNYWLSALLPALGFVLSTQSLPFIKRWWVKQCAK